MIEPYVPCLCEQQKDKNIHDRIVEENRQRRIDNNLSQADKLLLKSTFSADKFPKSEASRLFRDYCNHWRDTNLPRGTGLYIFGGVGVGKTFYASCIANEVAQKYGNTVKALSITKAINDLFSTSDKSGYIDELAKVDLLIIDDFGAERKTEYSNEVVYSILDERYKAQKPLILTSNTDYGILQNQRKTNRVFDRVIDMCLPYQMIGESMRGITI